MYLLIFEIHILKLCFKFHPNLFVYLLFTCFKIFLFNMKNTKTFKENQEKERERIRNILSLS